MLMGEKRILRIARGSGKLYAQPVEKPFIIRSATAGDLAALTDLEQRSFTGDRLNRRQWAQHLASSTAQVLVAEHAHGLLGDAVIFFRARSHAARLYSLVTRAEARGQGVGRALLAAAEQAARQRGTSEMRLEVRTDNPQAIALYEKAGYTLRDTRADYYEDGMTARRYRKLLHDT